MALPTQLGSQSLSSELNVSKNYHMTIVCIVFMLAAASPSSRLETISSVDTLEEQEFSSTGLDFDLCLKRESWKSRSEGVKQSEPPTSH